MKKTTKKIATIAASGVIAIAGLAGTTVLGLNSYVKEELKDKKSYEQILKDAESYGADLSIASNLSSQKNAKKFIRLKIEKGEPVLVTYQNDMEQREVEAIKKTVNYYNNLFKTIDEEYSFKLISEDEKKSITDTVIEVINKDNSDPIVVGSQHGIVNFYDDEETFVVYSKVKMDWKKAQNYTDEQILYFMIHEFGHAAGLGDVYTSGPNKVWDYSDCTTIMNYLNLVQSDVIYPNDYATLQALYSNEYLKHDNYEDSVAVVKQKIENYSDGFYDYYCEKYMNKKNAINKLNEDDVIDFNNTRIDPNDNVYNYKVKVKDGKCYLMIADDQDNVLEKCVGDVHYSNGMMLVKKMEINRAENYSTGAGEFGARFMMMIYKDNEGKIRIADNLYGEGFYGVLNEENKEITNKKM